MFKDWERRSMTDEQFNRFVEKFDEYYQEQYKFYCLDDYTLPSEYRTKLFAHILHKLEKDYHIAPKFFPYG